MLSKIPGHNAEIGVADGRNAIYFAKLIKLHGDESVRQYLGFDSFDGFLPRDLKKNPHLSKDEWKENSKEAVLRRAEINDVEELIEVIEGDAVKTVNATLATYHGKKFQPGQSRFALLYIDCNAEIPALARLRAFLPHMVPGGIIAIDEKMQGGETASLLKFADKNGLRCERIAGRNVPMIIKIP
jgi:hypothetical protein